MIGNNCELQRQGHLSQKGSKKGLAEKEAGEP